MKRKRLTLHEVEKKIHVRHQIELFKNFLKKENKKYVYSTLNTLIKLRDFGVDIDFLILWKLVPYEVCLKCSAFAYSYAFFHKPKGERLKKLKKSALRSANKAYWWAIEIDRCPSDDTRNAVLKNEEYSFLYALWVDKCPRNDTRNAVLTSPRFTYAYSMKVDKCAREDTLLSVSKDEYYLKYYILFLKPDKSLLNRIKNEEISK